MNVEERKAKGLWPNEKLRYSEVLNHPVSVIEREECFREKCPITNLVIWFTKEP